MYSVAHKNYFSTVSSAYKEVGNFLVTSLNNSSAMNFLGNIIWFLLGGFLTAIMILPFIYFYPKNSPIFSRKTFQQMTVFVYLQKFESYVRL